MKKATVVFFSSLSQVSNIPNSQLFPGLVFENTTVTLLTNDEKEINEIGLKDEIKSLIETEEDAIYLVPSVVKDRFQKIGLFGDSFIRKKPAEQEAELKRLVSEKIKVTPEQITFDEVIEFDFVQESSESVLSSPEEKVTGDSLNALIEKKKGGLPLEEAKSILEALQKILEQAHKQGQMRLEFLRPTNLSYDRKKQTVTPVDWQISLPTKERDSYKSYETLTNEAGLDHSATANSCDDVYSLACITYELLSGEHPFAREIATEAKSQKKSPKLVDGLNPRQWEALTKGLAFERSERTQTINEFLEPFLKKTFYDFIQKMVEAPFFVGFVIGGGLLIFTIFYLYFGVQVSSLESRIQLSRKDAEVASSQNIGELQTQLAESRKQSAELQTQFDESRKQSAELQTQLDKSQKQSEESQTQLNNLLVSSIDTAEYALSKMGAVKCVSPPTNLVFSSTKRLVDNDWPKQKDNLLWIENRLERLIDVCQREKSKDKEAKQREKELADYKQKIHKLNLTPQ